MRYSLRWLLLAMAYVALVAGAVVSRNDLLADAVWLVSLLAIFYATVTASAATGIQRAKALGFTLLSGASILGLYLMPNRLPANRLISALGYGISSAARSDPVYVTESQPDPRFPGQVRRRRLYIPDSGAIVSVANAVGTMIAGWIGYGLAALAYNHSKRE